MSTDILAAYEFNVTWLVILLSIVRTSSHSATPRWGTIQSRDAVARYRPPCRDRDRRNVNPGIAIVEAPTLEVNCVSSSSAAMPSFRTDTSSIQHEPIAFYILTISIIQMSAST